MLTGIGVPTEHAEFFRAVEHDADGAVRLAGQRIDQLRRPDNDAAAGPVIDGAGTKIPAVEVAAEQHDLVLVGPALDLGDDIAGGRRLGGLELVTVASVEEAVALALTPARRAEADS